MISILHPPVQLDPATERKIARLRLFGFPCVFLCWALAVGSFPFDAYVPRRVGALALIAEVLIGSWLTRRIQQLKATPKT